ncbi:unnamed protein product, partial [Vitis vinifera]
MVAGKRYFSASDASENKQAQRCRRVFREFCHLSGLFAVADAIPFLGWLDLGRHEKTLKKTAKEMDSIAQEWLEEHRRRKDSGEVNSTQDFMDVMLSVLDSKNLGDYDADTVNKATCLALIVGGSDTTVVTLTWALSLLLNNRDTLKKAQEELDIQVGKERLVNEQDISKLVYLQAIVKETLRLYPPAALGGPRQFTEDCTLGGYHVSKGTRLILNLSKIQKDPRIWMTCPGIAFALQMLHLTLANFLQAFDFSTPSNAQVDMCESLGLTNMKSTPLEVLISPRMSLLYRYTTTKRLREAFSEFDGAQIVVKFNKAWGSLCDYAIKKNEQPLTWREESLAQIKEWVNAKKIHRKTDTETKLKKIDRMSNKEDRFQVYEDLVFAQKFLSFYSSIKSVFDDLKILKDIKREHLHKVTDRLLPFNQMGLFMLKLEKHRQIDLTMAVPHSSSLLQYLNITTIGVLGILFLSYYLLVRRSRAGKRRIAPEAAGAWPIIGHLHLLGGSQLPHVTLGTMADKYGPIFTIRLGVHRALVVSSREVAKECFTTNDSAVSGRPKLVAPEHLGYNYAMFAFSPYDAYWREVRKIVNTELLSNRRLELLKDVRASEVETSIKELYKLWAEKKNELGHEEEARRCQKAIREFFRLLGLFVVKDGIPSLGWLDLGGHEKAMKKTAKEIDSIAQEWLEEHRRRKDWGEDNGMHDFMDVLLSVLDGKALPEYDADTINKATSMALISGGTDTMTVTLTWALSLILNNRETLKKAKEELDTHVGKERLVNASDISKLVYLQAIVKETLRLRPPGPLSGPRQFTEDCIIGGYHVPKGTRLVLNLSKLHRDPSVWLDPEEFQPERFLTTHRDVDARGQHFQLLPFGAGRRSCPGITFALQMLHLALASFLHGFEVSTPSNAPVDMSEIPGLTNIKSTPLEILIAPRLPYNSYK